MNASPSRPELGIDLVVHRRRALTDTICEFDLRRADGGDLPPFRAGGSVIVQTPNAERRNYSLCNDERERDRYVIAVKLEATSRGGSRSMHEAAAQGTSLRVELARNGLDLAASGPHLLIAGGIGITPVLSLTRKLIRDRLQDFRLVYLARSRLDAAYADDIAAMGLGERAILHFSADRHGERFDLRPLLADNKTGQHLYYCGPGTLMASINLMSIHWPRSRIHAEYFGTAGGGPSTGETFQVQQSSTGRMFRVGSNQSILDALRAEGLKPAASCESGTCGKCRMMLVAGTADHRDMYLTAEERTSAVMPCVSRASEDEVLVLDF